MKRLGIADLGSNTARLMVYAYEPGEWFRITDGIRETVRLGQGLAADGRLSAKGMERALAAIGLFYDYASATQLNDLMILGTSAARDASNSSQLLSKLEALGQPVEVLEGAQEAELGVLAVANSFDIQNAWVMDLGGGSAQISLMQDRRYKAGEAYPLGAVRLTEAHISNDPSSKREVKRLEAAVAREIGQLMPRLTPDRPLICIGGTIRNLARMAQKRQGYPLAMLHGYLLSQESLEELVKELLTLKAKQRAKMPGLNPARADIILAGALVYRWILRNTSIKSIIVSGYGVREGAFYRHFLKAPHLLEDVRSFSVSNRAAQFPQPPSHVAHVRTLALRLFDQLEPLHKLTSEDRELLEAAAVLHDSGTTLDYFRHHKHGAYIITSAPLNGFSHRELALLAQIVRYHRKGSPSLGRYRDLTHSGDKKKLCQLATCLRIAESLERSRAGRVQDVEVTLGEDQVTLTLVGPGEPTLELWEVQKHDEVFEAAFRKKVLFDTSFPQN